MAGGTPTLQAARGAPRELPGWGTEGTELGFEPAPAPALCSVRAPQGRAGKGPRKAPLSHGWLHWGGREGGGDLLPGHRHPGEPRAGFGFVPIPALPHGPAAGPSAPCRRQRGGQRGVCPPTAGTRGHGASQGDRGPCEETLPAGKPSRGSPPGFGVQVCCPDQIPRGCLREGTRGVSEPSAPPSSRQPCPSPLTALGLRAAQHNSE